MALCRSFLDKKHSHFTLLDSTVLVHFLSKQMFPVDSVWPNIWSAGRVGAIHLTPDSNTIDTRSQINIARIWPQQHTMGNENLTKLAASISLNYKFANQCKAETISICYIYFYFYIFLYPMYEKINLKLPWNEEICTKLCLFWEISW